MRRRSGLALLAALALTVAGCAAARDEPRQRDPQGPVALAAPLVQDRLDATTGMVTVPLVARGAEVVRTVRLVSPYFEAAPAREFGQRVEPGRRVDFPVPYGAVRCPAGSEPTEVVLELDGRAEPLRVEVPPGGLTALHRRGCEEQELVRAFTVEWGSRWERVPGAPERLRGDLLLHRTGAADVTVTGITGSVLYDLAPRGSLARLTGPEPVALPVELGVRLCSKHGLTEAKKVFVFSLAARLGDGPVHSRTIEPPASVQQQARALLATCPPE